MQASDESTHDKKAYEKKISQIQDKLQEQIRINEELREINSQLSQSQHILIRRVEQMEARLLELEQQTRQQKSKQKVLIQRNTEMDKKNIKLTKLVIPVAQNIQLLAKPMEQVRKNIEQIQLCLEGEQVFKSSGKRNRISKDLGNFQKEQNQKRELNEQKQLKLTQGGSGITKSAERLMKLLSLDVEGLMNSQLLQPEQLKSTQRQISKLQFLIGEEQFL